MTGMEQTIERVARAIRRTREFQAGAAFGVPEDAYEDYALGVARALASAGLLAPAPLREEWGSSDQPDMNMEPEFRDEPAGWWSYVDTDAEGMAREHAGSDGKVWRRLVTDWFPADRAEGDGRAEQ